MNNMHIWSNMSLHEEGMYIIDNRDSCSFNDIGIVAALMTVIH